MMNRAFSLLVAAFTCVTVVAQEADSQGASEVESGWQKYCRTKADSYRIFPQRNPDQPFKRIPDPVLIHAQPIRGDQLGEIFIWVDSDQRPAAICSIVVAPQGKRLGTYYVVQESHSLYHEPIVGQQGNRRWSPQTAGLDWKPIPDVQEPRKGSENSLKLQSRRMARRFSAFVTNRGSGTDADEKVTLRLLPRPLYTYGTDDSEDLLVGAVFGFCMATDLEIILSIEARQTAEGYRWFYACGGFSDLNMFVDMGETRAWSEAPPRFGIQRPHVGYVTHDVTLSAAP